MLKKIFSIIFSTVLIFSLFSCEKEVFDKKTCTNLLFKKYKNTLTLNRTKLFDKNCKSLKLDYSMKICQKAFGQFFLGVKETTLKKRFGPQIMNCFTKSQIEKVKRKN